jgi:hypothetical protein
MSIQAPNISMERMRASRSAQLVCAARRRLARTAHAGRYREMTQQDAIRIAREFIATRGKSWQQVWPAKRVAGKLRPSRRSADEVWVVRSCRDGLDVTNIWIEISPSTGQVLYAIKSGGLRQLPEECICDAAAR